ncbi:hypothetical protein CK218_13540 [Mesorhizobium sp. WSM3879]|uniref:GCG_CRPN prefix-to-repeats domain-containing protein n=1 Tax=unclassified Mesorhizobium TaxID=325217 RepID=UPI000BAE706C|nr:MULTISPECIES: hypothetical protein [unclassified Mesorhizobium]PBB80395.1 hypothetical protein CK218_13540 [Mesorhizobium sp. WSM3879]RUW54535.1 hypothetical protein EOA32_05350 [Mesorhizobium sp. M1A.F.Ca.ET.072.01.1.1]
MNGLTKYSVAAALAIGGTAAASAASAMPIAPVAAPAIVEHVAWGCGPGWHPNRWGRCVPNRRVIYPGYYYWGGPSVYIGPAWRPWHGDRYWRRW